MKVCIHRGTKEIGGTCVEIESQGQRIVLDVGLPLDVDDPEQFPLHPVPGFERPDSSLLGVVISHPHQDHYGLAHRLPESTPFLIGAAAQRILEAAALFSPSGVVFKNVRHLEDRRPISLGPFTITPYLVDHSAYDSYAVLVEADGQRLFYSGDFRSHGRKGNLFEKLLRDPPKNVDVLLMEGTTLGREGTEAGFPSESDLEEKFVELFKQTPGMPLVWCSGQNIDRIVTVFRACKRAGRQFIIDLYTAHVLRATENENIPQAWWDGVRVFLPRSQKLRIVRTQEFEAADEFRRWRIFPEKLKEEASKSVLLFRPSMVGDVEEGECLEGARLICSVWSGYLEQPKLKPLLSWLHRRRIPCDECHTSGHASLTDLLMLREGLGNAVLVPVHTNRPKDYPHLFRSSACYGDGQWWQLTHR